MNILIPIGGNDRYFSEEEFGFPKPLIDVAGAPLVEHTIRPLLGMSDNQRFLFVVQDEDCRRFTLDNVLELITGGADIIRLKAPTQGAICSCLMAIDRLDLEDELVIVNSDQVIRADLRSLNESFRRDNLDAAILTLESTHPRFSYARLGDNGLIVETSEKRVISKLAIAGYYYFRKASLFIDAAMRVLMNDSPVQGGFFISQVLNELILDEKKVGHRPLPADSYFSLYSPEKVSEYKNVLASERSHVAASPVRPVLIVPMAGDGRRFAEAGYDRPKPFIDVMGKPMFQRVMENLNASAFRAVAVVREEHLKNAEHQAMLTKQNVRTVVAHGLTEGSACTILLAREAIDPEAPLMIANCDQIVNFDCRLFIDDCLARGLDGSIVVFRDPTLNPKWSYARPGANGLVEEVREKVAISDMATVGIYFFAKGRTFIDAAIDMITRNDRVRGEFYTAPVYNYVIAKGLKVGVFEIPMDAMHGIGVPEDLQNYLDLMEDRQDTGHVAAA